MPNHNSLGPICSCSNYCCYFAASFAIDHHIIINYCKGFATGRINRTAVNRINHIVISHTNHIVVAGRCSHIIATDHYYYIVLGRIDHIATTIGCYCNRTAAGHITTSRTTVGHIVAPGHSYRIVAISSSSRIGLVDSLALPQRFEHCC